MSDESDWKTWYHNEYLKSDHWQRTRNKRMEFDGNKCYFCGRRDSLNVHHLTYESLGEENVETDLLTLCADCHTRLHKAKEKYRGEILAMAEEWKAEATLAVSEIAEKYRVKSGQHLAHVVYEFVGDEPNKNIAKIIKGFRSGLGYTAGYGAIHPWAKSNTNPFSTASQELSKLRKRKQKK